MGRICLAAVSTLALLVGCGDDQATPPPGGGGAGGEPTTGGGGGLEEPVWDCEPGEHADAGGCVPAGVPPDLCPVGTVPADDRGCAAVLPDAPCADGEVAGLGEVECHPLAPCGAEPWFGIPVDATTQYVLAGYSGGDSDGSADKPWTTLQAAIGAAADGALVAVGEGSYAGLVVIDKPVTVWGRCPSLVELTGDPDTSFALLVTTGADGAEVRRLGFTGPSIVGSSGAFDVVLAELWLHDLPIFGLAVTDYFGPGSTHVEDVLIERSTGIGFTMLGSEASVERLWVRDVQPEASVGRGIEIGGGDGALTQLSLTGAIVERSIDAGVAISDGAVVTIADSLVSSTLSQPGSLEGGFGVVVQSPAVESSLTMTGSIVESSRGVGVLVTGSRLEMDTTTVRRSLPLESDASVGRGIQLQASPKGTRADALIARSAIVESYEAGVVTSASDLVLQSVVIADVRGRELDGGMGIGLGIQHQPEDPSLPGSVVSVFDSVIRDAQLIGVSVFGATAEVTHSEIRDVRPLPNGSFGDGVTVIGGPLPATATLLENRIRGAARAGIANFGATVAIGDSAVECQPVHLNGEVIGDYPFAFEDRGRNRCGCDPERVACTVLSADLEPPSLE